MAKTDFLSWDTTASANTDINGIGILGSNAVKNFDDAFRTLMAQLRAGVDGEVVYATKAGNYTALANDNNAWHRYTATATVSLTAAATLAANWHYFVHADGATVTIDPNASETINGATTLVLQSGQTAAIICTGTAFLAIIGGTSISGPAQQGYIYGLTLSNNVSDATNDIDIAVGAASADTSPFYLMQLASTLTKRLDAAWAVGSGNGGLDTGAIANTTYHVWLIQRSDTGVIDALFSASATAPTMPTNYDRKRRIGSIIRQSAAILPFSQMGDEFLLATPVLDLNAVSVTTTASTQTLASVPTGLKLIAIIRAAINNATIVSNALLSSLDAADQIVGLGVANIGSSATGATATQAYAELRIRTNTSSQIRARAGSSTVTLNASTVGWVDARGRT